MAKSQENGFELVTVSSERILQIIRDITSAPIVVGGYLPLKSPSTTSLVVHAPRRYGLTTQTFAWLVESATQGRAVAMSRNFLNYLESLT